MLETVIAIVSLIIIGIVSGLVFYLIFKMKMYGGLIGAIIIGTVGAIIGGFILDSLISGWDIVTKNPMHINFITSFAGAFFLLWIFSVITPNEK